MRPAIMKKRLCILFFLIGWFPSVYGQRSDNGNYVLLLNSASFGEAWSDVLYRSLVEEVRQQGVRVDTEELLVPMMKTPEDARAKREMLLAKYPVPPRAVIYIGDPGWLVCRPLFDREWKEVPTVICYSRDSMPASIEDLLGGNLDSRTAVPASEIAEGYNLTILKQPSFIRETIEMMRQLQPGMNTVALISDHRYISLRIREEVRQTVKKYFPDLIDQISQELTPMVATARTIKQEHPNAKVVFIGPCAAKKLEAMRKTVRSDVDFVITFEELDAMFEARGIDPKTIESQGHLHDATGAGRGYAVAGGVSQAIENCIHEYYPDVEVLIEHVEGLDECKKVLMLAKAGRKNGYLIEGMGCPGGCVAGAGTLIPVPNAKKEVQQIVKDSTKKLPPKQLREIELK